MSTTLAASLFGTLTLIFYGISDYLSAKSSKQRLSAIQINFAVSTVGLVIAVLLFLISGAHLNNYDQLFRIILSDILLTVAYLIFLKALSTGLIGVVVPISNMYPVFTIILSVIFLGSKFKSIELIAMIVIVAGAMILGYERSTSKTANKKVPKEIVLSLLAAIIWGASFFILDPIVNRVTWQTISITGEGFAFILSFVLLVMSQKQRFIGAVKESFKSKAAFGIGIFGVGGTIILYIGFSKAGNVAIPTAISSAGPLVTSILAAAIDSEKLGISKRVGALTVIGGIILLNL